jgi:hypothetical protein
MQKRCVHECDCRCIHAYNVMIQCSSCLPIEWRRRREPIILPSLHRACSRMHFWKPMTSGLPTRWTYSSWKTSEQQHSVFRLRYVSLACNRKTFERCKLGDTYKRRQFLPLFASYAIKGRVYYHGKRWAPQIQRRAKYFSLLSHLKDKVMENALTYLSQGTQVSNLAHTCKQTAE